MKRMTEIGLNLGTDKAEYHEFTELYDDVFAKVAQRVACPRILEIGILDGKSMQMYDQFFRGKAKIFGIDVAEKNYLFPHSETILTIRGDIMNPDSIEKLKRASAGELFDIIIDDGSHLMEHQQKTLVNLWPLLKPGGIFIVEDLHTSGIEDYNPDRTVTTLAMLKGLASDNNPEFLGSLYIDQDTLRRLYDDMETCIIAEIPFEQTRTQAPRVSITSIIKKREGVTQEIEAHGQDPDAETHLLSNENASPMHESTKTMEDIEREWEQRQVAQENTDRDEIKYQGMGPARADAEELAEHLPKTMVDKEQNNVPAQADSVPDEKKK